MLFPRSMRREKYAATSVCFARVSRTHSEMLGGTALKIIAHGGRKKESSISLIWFTYCSSSVGHGRNSLDIFVLWRRKSANVSIWNYWNNRKVLVSTTSTATTHHSWEFDWLHEACCTCGTHFRTVVCHALTFAVLTTMWTKKKKIFRTFFFSLLTVQLQRNCGHCLIKQYEITVK